jgi:hypothetical protein
MRRKIAPTAEWFVNEATDPGGTTPRPPGTRDDARAELRALLSVARAAERLVVTDRFGLITVVREDIGSVEAVVRALARLRRASERD